MLKFKAALFDLDGTLIDSTHIWKEIDTAFLSKRGLALTDEYTKAIVAMNFGQVAEFTKEWYNLDESADEIVAEWFEIAVSKYENNIKLKPYAKEYLLDLKKQGIKIALCTASNKRLFEPVLKNTGVYHLFDELVSTEQVERGKGFPDVYLYAADKLCVDPCDCIVFEDILAGVIGANAGDMISVAVYDAESKGDMDEMKNQADYYINDFSQMKDF